MFMTQNHTENLLGKPFSRDQFWSGVELSHDDVWFYVSTSYARVGDRGCRFYLFTKPSDLVDLIGETGEQFWIERVMAVTPPRMNGTGSWRMQQLMELIAVSDNTDLLTIDYVYKLENDLVYDTRQVQERGTVTWRQVLFSDETHAHSDSVQS